MPFSFCTDPTVTVYCSHTNRFEEGISKHNGLILRSLESELTEVVKEMKDNFKKTNHI